MATGYPRLSAACVLAILTGFQMQSASAFPDYYVSKAGNAADSSSNDGSMSQPWATVRYAAEQVSAGTIHVGPGIFVETGPVYLGPGVSLAGAGEDDTFIEIDSPTESTSTIINLISVLDANTNRVVVDGNQSVSELTVDCDAHTALRGILARNRNKLAFENIRVRDCELEAMRVDSKSTTYWGDGLIPDDDMLVANIDIHDSSFLNSGRPATSGWSYGALELDNIRDSRIHHNYFDESDYGGFNIKSTSWDKTTGTGTGANRLKIHNNTFVLENNGLPNGHREKGFAVELWNLANSEVFDNWTNGGYSIAQPAATNTSVHHNTFDMSQPGAGKTEAIEIGGRNNEIFANYMDSTGFGVAAWASNAENLWIHDNIMYNTRNGVFISAHPYNEYIDFDKDYIRIDNNTIDSALSIWGMGAIGARIQDEPSNNLDAFIRNLTIRNNIISNTVDGHAISLTGTNAGKPGVENISDTLVTHTLFHNNYNQSEKHRNDGNDIDDAGAIDTVVDSINVADPMYRGGGTYLGSGYQLTANSPAKASGINAGLPYLGLYPDLGAFVQDRSTGARIEAEMNYSVVEDAVGINGDGQQRTITVADRGMDSFRSVNIFDNDDTIRIHFFVPVEGDYDLSIRLRSGNVNGPETYWPAGYAFRIDGVHAIGMVGDPQSVSAYDESGGGVYWGNMTGLAYLSQGRHSLEIGMSSAYGMIDYMELHPVPDSSLSVGGEDGWVRDDHGVKKGELDAGSAGGDALRVGDDDRDNQYRSVVSFDVSLPSGAQVTGARLELTNGASVGDVSNLGAITVDMIGGNFGNDPALEKDDFSAAASVVAAATLDVAGVAVANLGQAALDVLQASNRIQLRLSYDSHDNNNRTSDYQGFYPGDSVDEAMRPRLVIEYDLLD